MALLDIRNLSVEIKLEDKIVKIIDNLSLTIDEGKICGLIGESGSGKSILAKILCNLSKENWKISADRFRFNDIELLKLKPLQRSKIVGENISMIFQDPLVCLDPNKKIGLQIKQNIKYSDFKAPFYKIFGWKKREAIKLLHRVGITDHNDIMHSYPAEITEGEGQKIMIAISIAKRPILLVADEPTTSLADVDKQQIFRLLSALNKNSQTTILHLSNNIYDMEKYANNLVVLYSGQTVEMGKTDELLSSPLHPYTDSLIHFTPDFTKARKPKTKLNTLKGNIPVFEHMPIGCRFGPRCYFGQKACINAPPLKRYKQRECACYYPLNQEDPTA